MNSDLFCSDETTQMFLKPFQNKSTLVRLNVIQYFYKRLTNPIEPKQKLL